MLAVGASGRGVITTSDEIITLLSLDSVIPPEADLAA
jgi:hypothetical protein